MKNYTQEDRIAARKKIPRPISDFLGSKELWNIYTGIQKKLGLNLRQLTAMAEASNLTIVGLEPEHALETNIHQLLPELQNAVARELVADLNDRVFKEAQRRVRENVVDPEAEAVENPPPDAEEEAENQRRAIIDAMEDDDPELLKLQKEEAQQALEHEKEYEEEMKKARAEAAEEARKQKEQESKQAVAPSSTSENLLTVLPSAGAASGLADSASAAIPVVSPAPARTIAEEKLGAPTQSAARAVSLPPENPPPQSPAPPAPHSPRAYKGNDPYREAAE